MSWTLKGATGEPLDATARSLESLRIESAVVRFQSLAEDTLTWTAATEDAAGTGTIVPRIGQVVELWRDAVRVFRGHAVAPKVGMKNIAVTVQGPWWWLDRIALTSDQTDATGTTAERATYVFATGSLKTRLETLIDRAIANGAPIRRGTVAAMFDVPHATVAERSCAAALAEVMQWCPDAVAWFDYSDTSGSGLPILNIGRRAGFTATTLTIGTDLVEVADLSPRLDLEVSRAELSYVTRQAATGKPAWALQASGTAAAGKRQIVTLSGPEITDYLPRDDFATGTLRTAPVSNSVQEMYLFDPMVKEAIANGNTAGFQGSYNGYGYGTFAGRPPIQCAYTTGFHRILEGAVQEWMKSPDGYRNSAGTLLPALTESEWKVQGWAYFYYTSSSGVGNTVTYLAARNRAVWGTIGGQTVYAVYLDYTIPVIDVSFDSLATLYRNWDYDFLAPPDDLAAELLAAQNWIPWDGTITTVADDVTGANLLAAKYNLAGTLTECATMAALARGCSHDLMRGRTTIELGAPARVDFGTLVSRIRQSPQDNIVYL
jgi:hypothetical protein